MLNPAAIDPDSITLIPLGGAGEIGMNLTLYGYRDRWLIVDCGVTFADASLPAVDLEMPDPSFIAERAEQIVALVLTHAHEDHHGAVPYLWPHLRCPVYATPFSAELLRGKLIEAGLEDKVTLHEVPLGARLDLPPFDVEFVGLTHSIPEPNALAIRTAAGLVLHTGDWKIDPDPLVGEAFDAEALRRIGDEGVLALVGDSTNVFEPGEAGSEAGVAGELRRLVADAEAQVAVTCFASNVARIASVGAAAAAAGRHLCAVGRSMHRIIAAARSCGYLADLPPQVPEAEAGYLPPDKVLYLITGSQGEPRGAMARIAADQHPEVALRAGDLVIFSSKVIPGNERPLAALYNALVARGIQVIGERDAPVHVSGHPNRDDLARMLQWTRPHIVIPVHGERRHLNEHARFARQAQVPHAHASANGEALCLARAGVTVLGEVPAGRWILDGGHVGPLADLAVSVRRKLMYNGAGSIVVSLDADGRLIADPLVVLQGIVPHADVAALENEAAAMARRLVEAMPLARRRTAPDAVAETARLAVRRLVRLRAGRKPPIEARVQVLAPAAAAEA